MKKARPLLRIIALSENNPYLADVRVRPHMEALSEAGYEVTVICPRLKGQVRFEVVNNVRIYRFFVPFTGINSINYIFEFFYATLCLTFLTLWVWLRHGMDLLHVYNPPDTLFVAALLPKLAGKTIVYDLKDIAPELYLSKFSNRIGFFYHALLWLERVSCRFADYIIVVNESYRRIIMERNDTPDAKITVIRQGPDADRLVRGQPIPELRERAKIIIAYLGLISNQDGIDHLLRALKYLDQRFGFTDWLCVIMGRVEQPTELEKLITELGIGGRILLTGFLPNEKWISILSTADIGVEPAPVNPLNNVSTMNKLMDYMALGMPSVAYDLPEHRVTAVEAALYATPDDEVDFARKLFRLVDNKNLRVSMGTFGRQRIEQELAWSFQKKRLLDLYAEIISSRKK